MYNFMQFIFLENISPSAWGAPYSQAPWGSYITSSHSSYGGRYWDLLSRT